MSNTFTVEIQHEDQTHTFQVPEGTTVLQASDDAGLNLPRSCTAGVCTTCAALLTEGTVIQGEGMGLSPELQAEGYALLCVAYPRENLKVIAGQEEAVYDRQFGRE